ncbi:zinc-ribbon domain-containing protein [Geobacter pelophilus]|uniref:Zinc-ribbon domain-containing protein n=1 Tax=Geoanaerobacter pelophilus TaxID=60036 RepID=A0AAW4L7T4_9BACT|nr:DUF898 family protein [Geoanaerobacter pelophilus]MBT0664356.1 zinc-ribbon domain-containing protein [Geoanaerobacter pelophilus]
MPILKITCPHCSFSREIDDSAIPAGVVTATCPQCRQKFTLAEATVAAPSLAAEATEPLPSPVLSDSLSDGRIPDVPPQSQRKIKLSFTGNAKEYFGIWIVNTLLKILTLGVYSAWAKVRKRQYFYGNTFLGKAAFDYLADPKILFRGWLIAAVFFLLYSIGNKVSPVLTSVLGLLFFLGMPWLIVRSRAFNLRNSDHRNIRFTFNPDYREAYLVFAGLPMLIPFTLGLIFPYMVYRQRKFFVENSGYGRTRFAFAASAKEFYVLFIKAIAWFILIVIAVVAFLGLFSAAWSEFLPLFRDIGESSGNVSAKAVAAVMVVTFLSFNLMYLYFVIYIRTSLTNLTWNATRISKSHFISTLRVRDMAWLYLSSAIAILFSFGLLVPWASIRITRYKMENLAVALGDDMEGFLGWGHTGVGPAGEEIGDMFGIDIGL